MEDTQRLYFQSSRVCQLVSVGNMCFLESLLNYKEDVGGQILSLELKYYTFKLVSDFDLIAL